MSYLKTQNLAVGYDKKILIQDLNLQVKEGEIVTLIGPNGSGKSTILKTITRQLERIDGAIFLEEKEYKKYPNHELAKCMSMVMTQRIHPELMTCEEVVESGRYPYTGKMGQLLDDDKKKVEEAFEMVEAKELKQQLFAKISDGQRQRIMLARAICQEPKLLILDEPTSFLDIQYKLELIGIIKRLAKEKKVAILMSLHELDLAERVSDLLVCVRDKKIDRIAKPYELVSDQYINDLFQIKSGSYHASLGIVELEKVKGEPEVFVISGGGCGIPVFRELQKKQIPFATGVLFENDVEYQTAKALSTVIFAPAFDEIRDQEIEKAKKLIRNITKLILCKDEFGKWDRRNEELLSYARELGIPIIDGGNWLNGN